MREQKDQKPLDEATMNGGEEAPGAPLKLNFNAPSVKKAFYCEEETDTNKFILSCLESLEENKENLLDILASQSEERLVAPSGGWTEKQKMWMQELSAELVVLLYQGLYISMCHIAENENLLEKRQDWFPNALACIKEGIKMDEDGPEKALRRAAYAVWVQSQWQGLDEDLLDKARELKDQVGDRSVASMLSALSMCISLILNTVEKKAQVIAESQRFQAIGEGAELTGAINELLSKRQRADLGGSGSGSDSGAQATQQQTPVRGPKTSL